MSQASEWCACWLVVIVQVLLPRVVSPGHSLLLCICVWLLYIMWYTRSCFHQLTSLHPSTVVVLVLIKVAVQSLKCLENLKPVDKVCKANHEQFLLFSTAITCVIPPAAPVHGQRNVTGLTFGSTVIYSCKVGYTVNGRSIITCMANRQWSSNAPDCSRKL